MAPGRTLHCRCAPARFRWKVLDDALSCRRGKTARNFAVITASTTTPDGPTVEATAPTTAHSPVSAWSDPRHVSPHSDLPSSPRGESPLRSQLVKVFAERNGCLVDPEHTICSAWGSQARMHCGTDSPTPPVLSSTLDGRSSVAPGCLSPSPASSITQPMYRTIGSRPTSRPDGTCTTQRARGDHDECGCGDQHSVHSWRMIARRG